MTDSRKLVRVFLASPSDLSDERRAANLVVEEFNDLLAEEFGYQIELVGWEDTVSVFGRPQATINRELERCELFVGLMWKRWGTPPDVSGQYTSGFDEEFRKSVYRRLNKGQPEISLLFKYISPEFLNDPGDELKKVLAFKEQLIAEKTILFETFSDNRDFEKKFRRCITAYIRNLRAQEIENISDQGQASATFGEKPKITESTDSTSETPFSIEGAKFLREFISTTERSNEQQPITAVEVARFRLLASLVGSQGNDEQSLGVHDANLLFSKRSGFTFGHRELNGLLSSGLENYSHENTPLWHWLAAVDGLVREILPLDLFFGSMAKRVGALKAMTLISEPLFTDPSLDRKVYLDSWFSEGAENNLKVAALVYLSDCGITSDLAAIRQEFNKNNSQTINAATDAIIRINLRDSREKAISALFEIQPSFINKKLLLTLFDNDTILNTELLMLGVGHQNSNVRLIVIKLLRKRRALTIEILEKLTADSDASIRFEALKSLIDAGRTFSDDEAKKILINQATSGGVGLFGSISGRTGETYWNQLRQERLRSLTDKELEEVEKNDGVFNLHAHFILVERHFKKYSEDLRKSIDDQYKTWFSQWVHSVVERLEKYMPYLNEDMQSLEESIRKDATRHGLDIICCKADASDLGRVRTTLKSDFVNYSDADIEYLSKVGEWEDIQLIISCIERPNPRASSLLSSAFEDSRYRKAARAIYSMGRTRLSEVLAMPMPSELLSHLITEIPDEAFRSLNEAPLILLLRSLNDNVRKVAALKCIKALQNGRVAELLANYMSGDQPHYYNVVHWLDFGVSVPKDRVLPAVEKVINKDWRS